MPDTDVQLPVDDMASEFSLFAPFFEKDPPARTTVEARLMIDIKVEIEAIAYAPLG